MRKFGKITLLASRQEEKNFEGGRFRPKAGVMPKNNFPPVEKVLSELGPEPLEKQFAIENFKLRINKKPNGKIKTVLMDQNVVAGIGNIYSDEILWRAGVHPERKISTLKDSELKLIFKAIKETLAKGIDFGGDSMSDYKNIYGLPGKFQLHHEAYRRTGEKCRRSRVFLRGRKSHCEGIIKRKVINGRSAHFCSVHQK
jgi:formamidopyrimidine-DNA glycosylase